MYHMEDVGMYIFFHERYAAPRNYTSAAAFRQQFVWMKTKSELRQKGALELRDMLLTCTLYTGHSGIGQGGTQTTQKTEQMKIWEENRRTAGFVTTSLALESWIGKRRKYAFKRKTVVAPGIPSEEITSQQKRRSRGSGWCARLPHSLEHGVECA